MSLVQYLKDTQGELKHVSWPTQKQTIYFTIVVIAVSIFTAVFLGAFDLLFEKLLSYII
jgi:preprotein translocase subunit SecE